MLVLRLGILFFVASMRAGYAAYDDDDNHVYCLSACMNIYTTTRLITQNTFFFPPFLAFFI